MFWYVVIFFIGLGVLSSALEEREAERRCKAQREGREEL